MPGSLKGLANGLNRLQEDKKIFVAFPLNLLTTETPASVSGDYMHGYKCRKL